MGLAGGLLGLNKSVDRMKEAQFEQQNLTSLYNFKKNIQKEEQQAEVSYQQALANVEAQASQLLEGDRTKVREKAIRLQKDMRAKMNMYDSKRAFMADGGISTLSEYQRSLTMSEAFTGYKENKLNMQKILLAKEKGYGSRINEIDNQNLINYNINGEGKITYTGLLNEIDIDEMAYEFGHQITAEEILNDQSAKLKIIANFEQDLGRDYVPVKDDDTLKEYIKTKGYTGRGKNTQILQMRLNRQRANAKAKENKQKESLNTRLGYGISRMAGKKSKDIGYMGKEWEKSMASLAGFQKSTKGYDNGILNNVPLLNYNSDKYKLRGGYETNSINEDILKTKYLNQFANKEGIIEGNASQMRLYSADGVNRRDDGDRLFRDDNEQYSIDGVVIGYKGQDKNRNTDFIIMDQIDADGNQLTEKNKEFTGDKDNSNGIPSMFIRLISDSNNVYFKEIPINDLYSNNNFGLNLGATNDLTETSKQQQSIQYEMDQYELIAQNQSKAQKVLVKDYEKLGSGAVDKALKGTSIDDLLNTGAIAIDRAALKGADVEKDNLYLSWLITNSNGDKAVMEKMARAKAFTTEIGNYDLTDSLYSKDVSDEQFIAQYMDKDSRGTSKETANTDALLYYKKWMATYNKLQEYSLKQ